MQLKHFGCGAHAGDVLFTLSYLLKCQHPSVLYILDQYVPEIRPLVSGTNVSIESATLLPAGAEDTWMANARHEAQGIYFQNQIDIIGFIQTYFNAFGHAWNTREDMLFQFEWLREDKHKDLILILNTQPQSGQCPGYSQEEINRLALDLMMDGQRVVKVCGDQGDHNYSLIQIACFSAQAKLIIGGASGPFFVTMNTAAQRAHRIVLLDPMQLDYGPNVGPIHNVNNVTEAREVLRSWNYLKYQHIEA